MHFVFDVAPPQLPKFSRGSGPSGDAKLLQAIADFESAARNAVMYLARGCYYAPESNVLAIAETTFSEMISELSAVCSDLSWREQARAIRHGPALATGRRKGGRARSARARRA